MRRTACGGCGGANFTEVLAIGTTPLADRFPATATETEERWPLAAWLCRDCWLMQLSEIVPDAVLYGADYGFFSGTSPSLVQANAALAARISERYPQARRIAEVACNDGDLLQHLQHMGREVVGIDPAHGPVAAAREKGLLVVRDFFGGEVAAEIRDAQGPVDLIVARNVVAHVADLAGLFGAFAHLLVAGGVLLVEFQYVADLLAGTQLDHLYHEHRYFHSVSGLASIAARHGLALTQVEHVEAQGGSIRAEFRRTAEASKTAAHQWRILEEMAGLFSLSTYEAFQHRALYARERINYLLSHKLLDADVAGLGATAKSCTLLHWLDADAGLIGFIEDPAPSKIGRFTPGTKIPIVKPGTVERPPVMLLLAWNYLSGVLRRERDWMEQGGRLLVPLPLPVVL